MLGLLFAFYLAHAQTTLRVPVFVTSDHGNVPVAQLNQQLAARGHSLYISEWVEVRDSAMSRARVSRVDANIAAARALAGGIFRDTERAYEYAPNDLRAAGYDTCYVGDPAEVADVALAASDYLYSEHFGLWGWRARRNFVVYDAEENGAYIAQNSPPLWRSRLKDDSVLLLTHVTANGRDLHVSRIRACGW